jgi:hypothetical protein
MVSPTNTGAGNFTLENPRLAKAFWEVSITDIPSTKAMVTPELTITLPRGPFSA